MDSTVWTTLLVNAITGAGLLIVWFVHNLSKPWLKNKQEVKMKELDINGRMSTASMTSQEKLLDKALNKYDEDSKNNSILMSTFPSMVAKITDGFTLTSLKLDKIEDKLDITKNELMNEIRSSQIKELMDRIGGEDVIKVINTNTKTQVIEKEPHLIT